MNSEEYEILCRLCSRINSTTVDVQGLQEIKLNSTGNVEETPKPIPLPDLNTLLYPVEKDKPSDKV